MVGAGVFGAWTALELARSGAKVLLVDQHAPANSRASSGGETRIIRMTYGADEIYTRSSVASLAKWKANFPEYFLETGALVTSRPGDPYLIAARRTLTRLGCAFEWLNTAALCKRFPQCRFDADSRGIYEPHSGVLLARRSVQAVVTAAVEAGVRYQQVRAPAPPLHTSIRARAYIYACGPWLARLFPDVIGRRIQPSRQQVFFFGPPAGDARFSDMPAWISFHDGAYAVPALDGRGFKIGVDHHGPLFDPETGNRAITAGKLAEARMILKKRFPALAGAPLVESRVCQYENTSSGDFLIDRHPKFENVWLVGGGSGHGFKHGPFVGEYVVRRIKGEGEPEPRFSLASKSRRRRRAVY